MFISPFPTFEYRFYKVGFFYFKPFYIEGGEKQEEKKKEKMGMNNE